jgi:hypothetical protein
VVLHGFRFNQRNSLAFGFHAQCLCEYLCAQAELPGSGARLSLPLINPDECPVSFLCRLIDAQQSFGQPLARHNGRGCDLRLGAELINKPQRLPCIILPDRRNPTGSSFGQIDTPQKLAAIGIRLRKRDKRISPEVVTVG